MDGGIYKITNTVNGKIYIGRTKSFKRRFYQYVYDFKNQRYEHMNSYLLNSMNKYGFENFQFDIIEYCDNEVQPDRENQWIEKLNSTERSIGYNLRKDVGGAMVTHISTSEKISNRLKVEWSTGKRSGHSEKLKNSWDYRSREEQSDLLTGLLTKWVYIVDGEEVLFKELKEKGLKGVLGKFAKEKVNKVNFKGHSIERISYETRT